MKHKNRLTHLAIGLFSTTLVAVSAFAEAPEFSFSGFVSAIGGKVLSGTQDGGFASDSGLNCPCYLSDWANAGVYDDSFSFEPESHVGGQMAVKFNDDLSLTAQVVSRAVDPKPKLEWLYLTYNVNPDWTIQAGRKRIPLYFYSDFQDIGLSFPWVTPPAELYGWEATNYNGISVRHTSMISDFELTTSVMGGSEKVTEDRYFFLYGQKNVEVKWKNILGGDFQVAKNWFTGRIVYLQARPEFFDKDSTDPDPMVVLIKQDMKAYGIALNADFGKLFILTEFASNDRKYQAGYTVKAPAFSVGAGYRMGNWTPFINYGSYQESTDDASSYAVYRWTRSSVTLRYDVSASSAIKLQYEKYIENTDVDLDPAFDVPFLGDSTTVRMSFDLVF